MADALAATIVEPSVAAGSHRPAAFLALVPRHTLRLVGDGAVHRDLVRIRVLRLQVHIGGVHEVLGVTLGPVQRRIDVDRKGEHLPAALCVLLRRDDVVQAREPLEILDVRLLRQLVGRLVRLRAHLQAAAALGVQVAQTFGALLAAGAALHIALTALRQHALRNDARAHHLVAAVHWWNGETDQHADRR
uniref:Uncharacterized protein n=1 Tax=Anopheles albimanus TaxID=7167 RepID=A0A182FY62_ANOAL